MRLLSPVASTVSRTAAVAYAEVRSTLRLARTWVFLIPATLLVVVMFSVFTAMHGQQSGSIPFAGLFGPGYLLASLGVTMVWIFLIGAVFLALDVRSRDVRERIVEVVDSRPISNMELLAGRLLGITSVLWLAAAASIALVCLIGAGMDAFVGWMGGMPSAPLILAFLFVDCLPTFLVFGSAMILIAVVVRLRIVIAALALILIGLQIAAGYITPFYLIPVTTFVTAFVYLPSEVSPVIAELPVLLQRCALLMFTVAFLNWAAGCFPRREQVLASSRAAFGAAFLLAGAVLVGYVVSDAVGRQQQVEAWKVAHSQWVNEVAADITRIEGTVSIEPGKNLHLDLRMTVEAPEKAAESLLFTFNPGLSVSTMQVDGREAFFTHEDGALRVEGPFAAEGESVEIEIEAGGLPLSEFSYLDSPLDPSSVQHSSSQLIVLGSEPMIFRRDFVALMPGTHWLPSAGSAVRGLNPELPKDFFTVDLEVVLPEGWDVAGPGRREVLPTEGRFIRYRFHPSAPMPMIGLIASRFHRTSTMIEGVEFALLLHPDHLSNLDVLEDAAGDIKSDLSRMLEHNGERGTPYPYGGLNMVEVPNSLRIHGSGWNAPSVQAMPGILLLREHSFPTARMDAWKERSAYISSTDRPEHWKRDYLDRFFRSDSFGGNPYSGFARNLHGFVTAARGPGAPALNQLVHQLIAGSNAESAYFSAFKFVEGTEAGREMMSQMFESLGSLRGSKHMGSRIFEAHRDRASTWSESLGASLAKLDYVNDPATAIEVIATKVHWAQEALFYYSYANRDFRVDPLLAELRSRFAGTTYTYEDFMEIADELGMNIESKIGDWIWETSMAGFIASATQGKRLADDSEGNARYLTTFHVHNSQPTSGWFRLQYTEAGTAGSMVRSGFKSGGRFFVSIETSVSDAAGSTLDRNGPYRVPGLQSLQVNLITDQKLRALSLVPFLSLNRDAFEIRTPALYAETNTEFEGSRVQSSDWRPQELTGIVIDDLDESFSVDGTDQRPRGGIAAALERLVMERPDMDAGLPEYDERRVSSKWTRQNAPFAHGKYRKTLARAGSGRAHRTASFRAVLPDRGLWRLQYHVARTLSSDQLFLLGDLENQLKTSLAAEAAAGVDAKQFASLLETAMFGPSDPVEFSLRVESGNFFDTVSLNISTVPSGWHTVGEFELQGGSAVVTVIPGTSGAIADAVRWIRVEGNQAEQSESSASDSADSIYQ